MAFTVKASPLLNILCNRLFSTITSNILYQSYKNKLQLSLIVNILTLKKCIFTVSAILSLLIKNKLKTYLISYM